jgi:D-alanyl-D-alanine carboxypeptidase
LERSKFVKWSIYHPDLLLWGHGGQTLGFESDIAAFAASGISIVGWASSSNNIMALGSAIAAEALRQAGLEPN